MLISNHAKSFVGTRSSSAGINNQYGLLDEPTYLVFEPIFIFNSTSGLLADEQYTNSALSHLKRIGEYSRYKSLKHAITKLKELVENSPWSFRNVTGFNEAMHRKFDAPIIENGVLNIQMLESLDMRVSNIIHRILEVIYDQNRKVEVIPRNLQEFSLSLLIHELRVFQNTSTAAQKWLNQSDAGTIDITKINHVLLHFGKCRLMQTSGNSMFETFSNEDITEAMTNMDIEFKVFAKSFHFNSMLNDSAHKKGSMFSGDVKQFADGTTARVTSAESHEEMINRKINDASNIANELVKNVYIDNSNKPQFEDSNIKLNERRSVNVFFDEYDVFNKLQNADSSFLSILSTNVRKSINVFKV